MVKEETVTIIIGLILLVLIITVLSVWVNSATNNALEEFEESKQICIEYAEDNDLFYLDFGRKYDNFQECVFAEDGVKITRLVEIGDD